MIEEREAKLSDYSYPITKSSNWTAVQLRSKLARGEPITSEYFVIDTISINIFCY